MLCESVNVWELENGRWLKIIEKPGGGGGGRYVSLGPARIAFRVSKSGKSQK